MRDSCRRASSPRDASEGVALTASCRNGCAAAKRTRTRGASCGEEDGVDGRRPTAALEGRATGAQGQIDEVFPGTAAGTAAGRAAAGTAAAGWAAATTAAAGWAAAATVAVGSVGAVTEAAGSAVAVMARRRAAAARAGRRAAVARAKRIVTPRSPRHPCLAVRAQK